MEVKCFLDAVKTDLGKCRNIGYEVTPPSISPEYKYYHLYTPASAAIPHVCLNYYIYLQWLDITVPSTWVHCLVCKARLRLLPVGPEGLGPD